VWNGNPVTNEMRALKWLGVVLGAIVVLLLAAIAVLYLITQPRLQRTYAVQPEPVAVSTDPATIAQGAHVAVIRGCADCHTETLGGQIFIDEAPLMRLSASNLTGGRGGVGGSYTVEDWVRAIRHGIGPDGKPLLFMPSHEFAILSDADLGALIAYIRQVPPVDNELPANSVRPLGRFLFATGRLPLVAAELIDHGAVRPAPPTPGPTADYGAYLATGCAGCHGETYSGGPIPGAPPGTPPAKNITPDPATGIGRWTEADFFRALREGKRPDGSDIHPFMPWRLTSRMTDDEIRALWQHLRRVEARPQGNR
jgi:mono/diheme cytochrome c family protein